MPAEKLNHDFNATSLPEGGAHKYVEVFFSPNATLKDLRNFAKATARLSEDNPNFLADVMSDEGHAYVVYEVNPDQQSQSEFLKMARNSPIVLGVAAFDSEKNTIHMMHQKGGFLHPDFSEKRLRENGNLRQKQKAPGLY